MSENIVKQTAKELGMTYKELGEAVGYGEETISKASRTGTVSKSLQKAIELYLKTLELEKELEDYTTLKTVLLNITKP